MNIQKQINSFYDDIKQAHTTLLNSKIVIEERQSKIMKYISNLQNSSLICVENVESCGKFKNSCIDQIKEYIDAVSMWSTEIDKYIKGKKFVNQFEESILLIVFGDVKAGKSAIGNFVSGADFIDTRFQDLHTNPQFYIYDYSDKSKSTGEKSIISDGRFKEDVIEATSTIQYFTLLDGLTWVDTPGIHSLTVENEELAKEYIKYADLILFLTPSNNPCKQDEGNQIKELILKDKPLLITITKSDTTVAEVKNSELIRVLKPKSLENRREQEKFLATEIEKMGGNNILSRNEYISLSTKLARKAICENDETLFLQSNFLIFYNQIGKIISEKALDLKMKRPRDEVNYVIDEIISGVGSRNVKGIDEIFYNVENILYEIDKQKKLVDDLKFEILNYTKSELLPQLQELLFNAKNEGRIKNNPIIYDEISSLVSKSIANNISEKIGALLTDFKNSTKSTISIRVITKYEEKFTTFEYPIYETRNVTRSPRGLIEYLESWILGKEFKEQRIKSKTIKKDIPIGDNFNEFINNNWKEINTQIDIAVKNEIDIVKSSYFGQLEQSLIQIKNMITVFKNQLLELKFKE